MNNLFLIMQGNTANGQQGGGGWQMLIFFGLIILIFYFFMIRPQQKKQKKMQEAREALKKGDHIVTIGGIHGKIADVQDTTFVIEVEDGSKMKIEKAAVAIDGNEGKKENK